MLKETPPIHKIQEDQVPDLESSIGVRARSFDEAQKIPKVLSDQTVERLLNSDAPLNERIMSVKTFFDGVEPTVAERGHATDAEFIKGFHEDMTEMVARNLSVSVRGFTSGQKAGLRKIKEKYIEGIVEQSQSWGELVDEFLQGGRPRGLDDGGELRGLNIPVKGGEIDISDVAGSRIEGLRPNIRVQRQIGGQFVHWETKNRNVSKLNEHSTAIDRRIYLNPKMSDQLAVFERVMTVLDSKDYSVLGKTLDRSRELIPKAKRGVNSVRADGIVLYVSNEQADDVLSEVLRVCEEECPDSFVGRKTPAVPTRIADGVAVGEEPHVAGASLTSHRARVVEEFSAEFKAAVAQGGSYSTEAFRSGLNQAFIANGIDPNNMAFNA